MTAGEKSVLSLVGALYEAAASPEGWEKFLGLAAQQAGCEKAVITLHDERVRHWDLRYGAGLTPDLMEDYNAHYGALNPTIQPLFARVRKTGSWYGLSRSLVGERDYKRSEYYSEYGRKCGSYWGVMGAVCDGPRVMTTLSMVRSEREPALGREAVNLMGLLMPHLKSVVRIHHTMESLREMAGAAVTAVDRVEASFVAVDVEGEAVLVNQGADKLLSEGDGLLLRNRRFSARSEEAAKKLDALLRSTADTGAGKGVEAGGAMLVHRQSKRPLGLTVVPYRSNNLLAGTSPCALVFISDPEKQPGSRSAILSGLYELTPAECRLADLLLQDLELVTAAEFMGITKGTARFVLKNIFRKTGTHRQPELMRFLAGLPILASVQ